MSGCIHCGNPICTLQEEHVPEAVFCGADCQVDYYSARHYHAWSSCNCPTVSRGAWMAKLADATPIWQISIPGTHDSCAIDKLLGVETQQWSLEHQLDAGIRYLDIRLTDNFGIHHGGFYLGTSWSKVLYQMTAFLAKYPSEMILVRLKPDVKLVWPKGAATAFAVTRNDQLGSLRGKVCILDDGASFPHAYRNYNTLSILDEYSVWFLPSGFPCPGVPISDKVDHILKRLSAPTKQLSLIHLSGSTGMFPAHVASKTNVATLEYITCRKPKGLGIVIADFPGTGLIDAIIGSNHAIL